MWYPPYSAIGHSIKGSYKCKCHEGYNGDGFSCRMILPDHADCNFVGDICNIEDVFCVEGFGWSET